MALRLAAHEVVADKTGARPVLLLDDQRGEDVGAGPRQPLAERGEIDPDERVVLLITGEGLKTLDAVKGTFETTAISASYEEFESALEDIPSGAPLGGTPAASFAGAR